MTLEDLSVRCLHLDLDAGPSVSYLSMIENGKRVPSEELLKLFAEVFQRDVEWFFDESMEADAIDPAAPRETAMPGLALEPSFLFTDNLLQTVIPELLEQTATTGRQFAHLLIRAHQEANKNVFPDLEKAAERIGRKQFPLSVNDLIGILKHMGMEIRWFTEAPRRVIEDPYETRKKMTRSFFEPPNLIFLNDRLKAEPARLKYDLANHIAHKVLHDGDGARPMQVSGIGLTQTRTAEESSHVDAREILHAWRGFECAYFAAALLAPRAPFRQYLARNEYSIDCGNKVDLTNTLVMRRMSSVSTYQHWHYFDAHPPGRLRAVYRGNGIPLPWGNMTALSDPCQHWAVFRMLNSRSKKPSAQISVLRSGDFRRLYTCQSIRSRDAAGNRHVLCVGVDVVPALQAQGADAESLVDDIEKACNRSGGTGAIPESARRQLQSVGKLLNIGWIAEGAEKEATIICPRSAACPRDEHCLGKKARQTLKQDEALREQHIRNAV